MNPWADLMRPLGIRPGQPLREPPSAIAMTGKTKTHTARAAAAMVVTDSGIWDKPIVRLIPIVAIDFTEAA